MPRGSSPWALWWQILWYVTIHIWTPSSWSHVLKHWIISNGLVLNSHQYILHICGLELVLCVYGIVYIRIYYWWFLNQYNQSLWHSCDCNGLVESRCWHKNVCQIESLPASSVMLGTFGPMCQQDKIFQPALGNYRVTVSLAATSHSVVDL